MKDQCHNLTIRSPKFRRGLHFFSTTQRVEFFSFTREDLPSATPPVQLESWKVKVWGEGVNASQLFIVFEPRQPHLLFSGGCTQTLDLWT